MMPSRRRIGIALALSLCAHVAVIALAPKPPMRGSSLGSSERPLIVTLVAPPPEPAASAAAEPQAPAAPKPAPAHRPPAKPMVTARPHTPGAAPPVPVPEEPKPTPAPAAPAVDMLAMINARRERRRVAESASAREGAPSQAPAEDAGAAAIARNLETLKGDDQTGGVFQILDKSTLSAEYAFNGWRADTKRRWREVIEVHVRPGEDIDRAIVQSMIALIRGHYTGDFLWESRRLGRVVTLSARVEENDTLEDFLMREFFGEPILNPRRR